jgi:hypothetical protein
MKKNYTVLLLLLSFIGKLNAQTTLTAGDIAIVLINATDNNVNSASNDDNISFVLLTAITSGTQISFTDYGWRTDASAFQTALPCGSNTGAVTDGIVTWTANTALPYGTVINMNVRNNLSTNIGTISATQAAYNSTISLPLYYVSMGSAAGESVIAYQGTVASPTLITAIRMNTAWSTTLNNCDYNASNCGQPTGATSFIWGQVIGNGTLKPSIVLTRNKATDLATIYNIANWDFGSTAYSTSPVLGVSEFSKENFVLYPNPTIDFIQIDIEKNLNYLIVNHLGQIIKSGQIKNKIITVNDLVSGVYVLKITDGEKLVSKKFIKE